MLQALAGHYDRLRAQDKAPEFGYSREAISFAIVLTGAGDPIDVIDLRDVSGPHPRPVRRFDVPRPPPDRRGKKVVPSFLWDNTTYALGVARDRVSGKPSPCTKGEAEAFKKLHDNLLANTGDDELLVFKKYLSRWCAEDFSGLRYAKDMLGTNVVFRIDGTEGFLHERASARRVWDKHLAAKREHGGICLVTGERSPVARLHPPIKGVVGAQPSGAHIVSFNQNAFCSFGKKQGDNAQVSERAAFAYTTALNLLLTSNSGQHIQVGDTKTVFWAHAVTEAKATAAEYLFPLLFKPPTSDSEESLEIADKLTAVAEGRPLPEVHPDLDERTRFFVLGLSPNASRLSVRFWHEDSIGALAQRIAEHWRDLRLDSSTWNVAPPVRRLLKETAAQRKSKNISPTLGGALMQAILTGRRYPRALLAAVVTRMRADKIVNGHRVAMCKACLARDHRLGFEEKEVPMSLDRDSDHPAYLLGRLFAVYEGVQRAALGQINATIKDRYFGAASATPASVFPLLERGSAAHLASLRKGDKGGLAHWFDREIDQILSNMGATFPRSLRLEDQGRFAIGYHHQRNSGRSTVAAGNRMSTFKTRIEHDRTTS